MERMERMERMWIRLLAVAVALAVAAALRPVPLIPLISRSGVYGAHYTSGTSLLRASLQDPPAPAPASASASAPALDKPAWAAGGLLSDVVNALINFKPLFNVMKIGARNTLINTAESNAIPWRALSLDMEQKQGLLDTLYSEVEDKAMVYPDYYQQEFHAYDAGNLNWQAAFECESATMSMAIRTWPKENLQSKPAQQRLRDSFTNALKHYQSETGETGETGDKQSLAGRCHMSCHRIR
jgi:hypothetical protein